MLFFFFFIFIHTVTCLIPISPQIAPNLSTYKPSNYIFQLAGKQISSVSKASSTSNSSVNIPINPGIQLINTDNETEAFYIDISISDTTYSLIIDTGSAYSWLYDSNCKSDSCNNKTLYPTNTTNIQDQTSTFALAYGSETVTGSIIENSAKISNLSITDFQFGITDNVPSIFDGYSTNGILGLPANDSTSIGIVNIIEDLYRSSQISNQVFTISLNNSTNAGGIFVIGSIIDDLYQGNLSYTPVITNNNSYWMCELPSIYVNDYQVTFNDSVQINGSSSNSSRKAIVDSGTTSILLPTTDALQVHSFFENSVTDGENFAIYCNSTLIIDLTIGSQNFSLTPSDYLGQTYPQSSDYYGYCVSKLQGTDTIDYWVLGSVFLKKYFAVFDLAQDRIGFALQDKYLTFSTGNTTELPVSSSSSVSSSSGSNPSSQSSSSSSSSASSSSSSNSTSSKSSGSFHSHSSIKVLIIVNVLISFLL